jgi:hypothetical protein
MADEVKIPISLPGAGQAAADAGKVAAGLQGIGNASAGAAKSVGENQKAAAGLGEELANLGSRQSAAKDVIEGVDMASRGGAAGLFGLAKAAKNLWEILAASSPLGRLVQITAVVGAGFLALREKIFGAGEAAKVAENNFGQARSALETLNTVKLDAIKTEIDSVTERAKAMEDLGNKIDSIKKRLLTAKLNVELAEIETNAGLSPEEKTARTFAARERFAKSSAGLEDEALKDRRYAAQTKAENAADVAANAETVAARQRQLVESARQSPGDLAIVAKELAKQIAQIVSERARLSVSGDPTNIAKSDALATDQRGLQGTLDYVRARQSASQTEQSKLAGAEQQKQLAALESAARDARKKADDAQREFETIAAGVSTEESSLPIIRGLESRERRLRAGQPEPESRITGQLTNSSSQKSTPVYDTASINAMAREQGVSAGKVIAELIIAANDESMDALKQEVGNQI